MVLENEWEVEVYEHCAVETLVCMIWKQVLGKISFSHQSRHSLQNPKGRLSQLKMGMNNPQTSTPPAKKVLDGMCELKSDDDQSQRKLFAVGYKPADVLTPKLLSLGLRDMDLTEIIYRDKPSTAKDLKDRERAEMGVTCIIVQLFDYMIDSGINYGYVTGGETFIFAHFDPQDVNTLFYDYVIPNAAVGTSHDLTKTAVGLVASFAYLAKQAPVLDCDWSRAKRKELLDCSVDDNKAMSLMTLSLEPTIRSPSPYQGRAKPSNDGSERLMRSKTKAVTSCRTDQPKETQRRKRDDDDDVDDDEDPAGAMGPANPPSKKPKTSSSMITRSQATKSHTIQTSLESKPEGRRDNRRAYCTQACLRGLVNGLRLDLRCPNVEAHRATSSLSQSRHVLDRQGLQGLVKQQLRNDRDFEWFDSLDRSGWAGSLFYVTLATHGYTFVAKGTVLELITVLHHEARIYDRLKEIQGKAVPIYLGSIDLSRPYWLTCTTAIEHISMLSWGGEEAWRCDDIVDRPRLIRETKRTVKDVCRYGVDQGDLREPNVLWNQELGRAMLIDFEYGTMQD